MQASFEVVKLTLHQSEVQALLEAIRFSLGERSLEPSQYEKELTSAMEVLHEVKSTRISR